MNISYGSQSCEKTRKCENVTPGRVGRGEGRGHGEERRSRLIFLGGYKWTSGAVPLEFGNIIFFSLGL